MEKKPPLIISGIALVFLILFSVTVETVADQMGFPAAIKRGWGVISDAGYADWVRWGALFFIGAASALWADWIWRVLKRRGYPSSAQFQFQLSGSPLIEEVEEMRNIDRYHWSSSRGDLLLFLEFKTPIEKPVISVAADKAGLHWREQLSSAEYALIKIIGPHENTKFGVHFVAQAHTENRRQHEYTDNEVQFIDNYDQFIEFNKQVTEFFSKPRWKRLFKKFKYLEPENDSRND